MIVGFQKASLWLKAVPHELYRKNSLLVWFSGPSKRLRSNYQECWNSQKSSYLWWSNSSLLSLS